MQYFVNHDQIDRAAGEIFSSERSRYYLLATITLAVAASAGVALGAIWLGLMLLIEETRAALIRQLDTLSDDNATIPHLALGAARAAAFATAPAMVWFSRADMGATLAVLLLATLVAHTALFSRRGAAHAALAAAPYGALALIFLADGAVRGDASAATACMLVIGFLFAAALHIARTSAHAERENLEIIRQLNAALATGDAAAWELDWERRELHGAARLQALFGRPLSYDSFIDDAFFAAPEDRALVKAAFSAHKGAFRRIAIEHTAIAANGAPFRVRHEGVVRTAPDSRPLRLSCVTKRVVVEAAQPPALSIDADIARHADAAAEAQADTLRTLANELSIAPPAPLPARATLPNILAALSERSQWIEDQVCALARARNGADSANLAKSQFLANMSHELRTPLNAIIGYAEILQEDAEDAGDAATIQDLNRILTAAKHLLSLINEILDLSKIEAGRMDVVAAAFDPLEQVDEMIATMRPLAEQNRNKLSFAGPRAEALAHTDATKLRQCLMNLLSNACKFTRDGAVEVSVDHRHHNGVTQIFFTVRDTGIGMAPEHLARLFQPFVQADPSITQQYGGTGLGLTITRRLAQLLGGDVSVESTLGHGATFTLHIPLDYADAAAALGAAAEVDLLQGPEGAPLVIVIEDEPDARDLAARALTRAGFAVQGVGGGEAGLALARSTSPALVLLDIYLPDRSGWRVLQALKHDPKTQDIPVIVLSVNEDRAHALSLGAAEHIVKPADRDMLAATVMRYARQRQDAAAAPGATITALTHKQAI